MCEAPMASLRGEGESYDGQRMGHGHPTNEAVATCYDQTQSPSAVAVDLCDHLLVVNRNVVLRAVAYGCRT